MGSQRSEYRKGGLCGATPHLTSTTMLFAGSCAILKLLLQVTEFSGLGRCGFELIQKFRWQWVFLTVAFRWSEVCLTVKLRRTSFVRWEHRSRPLCLVEENKQVTSPQKWRHRYRLLSTHFWRTNWYFVFRGEIAEVGYSLPVLEKRQVSSKVWTHRSRLLGLF